MFYSGQLQKSLHLLGVKSEDLNFSQVNGNSSVKEHHSSPALLLIYLKQSSIIFKNFKTGFCGRNTGQFALWWNPSPRFSSWWRNSVFDIEQRHPLHLSRTVGNPDIALRWIIFRRPKPCSRLKLLQCRLVVFIKMWSPVTSNFLDLSKIIPGAFWRKQTKIWVWRSYPGPYIYSYVLKPWHRWSWLHFREKWWVLFF